MTRCILNVTTHEYDKVLQLNHDGLVWDSRDEELLHGLEAVLGEETVNQLRQYDQCRMRKHDTLNGLARVEEDGKQELEGSAQAVSGIGRDASLTTLGGRPRRVGSRPFH